MKRNQYLRRYDLRSRRLSSNITIHKRERNETGSVDENRTS